MGKKYFLTIKPFAGYEDFDDCVSQNGDKESPEAFCAWLHHRETGTWPQETERSIVDVAEVRHRTFLAKAVKVLKETDEDGTETTRIRVPFSSLNKDRDGERFSEEGLDDMITQINESRIPLYLDHGENGTWLQYGVLDMVGYWEKATREEGVAYAYAVLDPDDPRATILEKKVENGLPIGFSVGFIPSKKSEESDSEEEEGIVTYHKSDLLEISAVGIPSNPDGVAQHAMASTMVTSKKLRFVGHVKTIIPKKEELSMKLVKKGKKENGEEDEEEITIEDLKEVIREVVREELGAMKEAEDEMDEEDDEYEDEEDKEEEDDEEEEKETPVGGSEDEEEEKSAKKKPKTKRPKPLKPKGIQTQSTPPKKKEGDPEDEPVGKGYHFVPNFTKEE